MSTAVSTGIPPIDTTSFIHDTMEESCTEGLDCHDMKGQHESCSPSLEEIKDALHWASILRPNLDNLFSGLPIDDQCYEVPRRKDSSPTKARLAIFIACLLYPRPSNSILGPLIKYQHDIVLLRRAIVAQRRATQSAEAKKRYTPTPKEKIRAQGPWDEINDPVSLDGVRALPMPVSVAGEETLKPFFQHLQKGGTYEGGEGGQEDYYGVSYFRQINEPPRIEQLTSSVYQTDMGEWEKGILYQDGRMDLCKMVVGPPHITALIDSLETNEFVRHFLLGNNMIGPTGASRIAAFVTQHPDKIETWYLAGNCIDTASFKVLASAFKASRAITNIWLKRNPLGPDSVPALVDLIHHSSCLRTLDLDQTELGDAGLMALFDALAERNTPGFPLKNIYLNGNGIGLAACKSIAVYLSSSNCSLESLYASNNPIGDAGSQALALGLATNQSLLRLNLRSCGLTDKGANAIIAASTKHACITALDIGQSFATTDLGTRYNYFNISIFDNLIALLQNNTTLQYLDLGITAIPVPMLESILEAVTRSSTLLVFRAESIHGKVDKKIRQAVRSQLTDNVKLIHGEEMSYELFEQGEMRWLISPKDVRLIDSSYRNRDAGLARRGLKVLDKWWKDETEMKKLLREA